MNTSNYFLPGEMIQGDYVVIFFRWVGFPNHQLPKKSGKKKPKEDQGQPLPVSEVIPSRWGGRVMGRVEWWAEMGVVWCPKSTRWVGYHL